MKLTDEEIEWWKDEWWTAEEYVRIYAENISVEEVRKAVKKVAELFDEKWIREVGNHPAFLWLHSRGLDPLSFQLSLGRQLATVERCTGVRQLRRDLKNPTMFESAMFELGIAVELKQAGHEVILGPDIPGGKKSDVLAIFDEELVYLEAKVLSDSLSQRSLDYFTMQLTMSLTELTDPGDSPYASMHYRAELDENLSSLFGSGPRVDQSIASGLVSSVIAKAKDCSVQGVSSFEIPHVGRFEFLRDCPREGSGVRYARVSPHAELKRILQRTVLEASQQLHPDHPGLIAIRTSGDLDPELTSTIVQALLQGLRGASRHVTAVLFYPVVYSMPTAWSLFNIFAVENDGAAIRASDLKAFRHLMATSTKRPAG